MTHEGSSHRFISVFVSDIVSPLYITLKPYLVQHFALNKKIRAGLFELKSELQKSHDFRRKAFLSEFSSVSSILEFLV